jgi:hypothetical protein
VSAKPTIVGISLSAVVGDQLAFETHPDAPETETEYGDLDLAEADRLDAAEQALLEAIVAAAAKPKPCRCERPLVLDDGTDDPVCSKCGRAPA